MKKFKVLVTRTSYAAKTIEVEADTETEASLKAFAEAGNHEFSQGNAEYDVEHVEEVAIENENKKQ